MGDSLKIYEFTTNYFIRDRLYSDIHLPLLALKKSFYSGAYRITL